VKAVAISQRVDAYPDRGENRDALDQRLFEFVLAAGFLPFPVPNVLGDRVGKWLEQVNAAAIVLSGGNDIGTYAPRDRTETAMLFHAEMTGCPVLGICRGMQMMAVHAGATLKPVTGHVRSRHRLRGDIARNVNSFHNISPAETPPGYVTLARSEDGEIEAFRRNGRDWEGWMWHPERETSFDPADIERMRALFNA